MFPSQLFVFALLILVPAKLHAFLTWDDYTKFIDNTFHVDQRNEMLPLMIGCVFILVIVFAVFWLMAKIMVSTLSYALTPSHAVMKQGP